MIALAKRSLLRKNAYLNMSFHSTTLVPGRTPFVRTQQDLEVFLRSIEALIKYVANEGVVFSGLPFRISAGCLVSDSSPALPGNSIWQLGSTHPRSVRFVRPWSPANDARASALGAWRRT